MEKKIDDSFYKLPTLKIQKQFPEHYIEIKNFVERNNLSTESFKESLYCYINNITTIILCKKCKIKKVKFENSTKGYKQFCSCKCAANSDEKKDKVIKTLKNKYGDNITNISQLDFVKKSKEKTFLERYGNVNPLVAFDKQIKETLLKNYGVLNASYSNEIKEKISKSNRLISKTAKIKRKETLLKEYGVNNACYLKSKIKDSKYESELRNLLGGVKLKIENMEFNIHIPNTKILIEVDGEYYHPNIIYDLDITQLNTVLNDIKKSNIAKSNGYELLRIRKDEKIKNIKDAYAAQYYPNYIVDFDTILISKEKLKKYIALNGADKLERYLDLFVKCFRTLYPEFIYSETESIEKIFKSVRTKAIENKTFFNKSFQGNKLLKGIFKSYYNSSFKNNESPFEKYKNDDFLKKIIKYRIGLNNQNEIYDLSFKNILNGMSAIRQSISFFSPTLAFSIYNHFITTTDTPIVLDPCCGFGGRMLGFFIRFPQGKYIGCEPNTQTYSELLILKKKISDYLGYEVDCEIHCNTIESFVVEKLHKRRIDFTFTSIPYYDLEKYSEDIVCDNYISFDDWKNKFI